RGLRAERDGADPDRAHAQPAQRGLPAREGRADGPHAAPPGPQPRRGAHPRGARARRRARRGARRRVTFAIAVGRFYAELAERLVAGAQDAFGEAGAGPADVFDVPGAFELPMAAKLCAESGRYAGVACLGAVIRGETDHYDYVCAESARGIQDVQLRTGVPCAFGVLTVDTMEQALARSGGDKRDSGRHAAEAVVALARLRRQLGAD